jgi:hypothetical protein
MIIGLFLRELDPHPTFLPKSHTQTVLVTEVLVDLDIEVLDELSPSLFQQSLGTDRQGELGSSPSDELGRPKAQTEPHQSRLHATVAHRPRYQPLEISLLV